jgi:hypothetical protein
MRDTIDMAREACPYTSVELRGAFYDGFVKAAALVRADEREKYEAIVSSMTKLLEAQQKRESVAIDMIAVGAAAEREACAKVCDDNADDLSEGDWDSACINCADKIRARGNT